MKSVLIVSLLTILRIGIPLTSVLLLSEVFHRLYNRPAPMKEA